MPASRARRPCAAYRGLMSAWVERAPRPAFTAGQSAPTAKNRLATATPRAPEGCRATRDQVIAPILQAAGRQFHERKFGRRLPIYSIAPMIFRAAGWGRVDIRSRGRQSTGITNTRG